MIIPAKTLYFMLCYAWDAVEESETIDVDFAEGQSIADLLALVLSQATSKIIARGVWKQYEPAEQEVSGVLGKIDVSKSAKRLSFPRGFAVCEFDNLTYDCLPNRIIKTTLNDLARSEELEKHVRAECHFLSQRLSGVAIAELHSNLFQRMQVPSSQSIYKLILSICELFFERYLAIGETRKGAFIDYLQDERFLWRLFQTFVTRFLTKHCTNSWYILSRSYPWHMVERSAGPVEYMPRLNTDVVAESQEGERAIVIDTKFYKDMFAVYYGKHIFRPEHLYQIFAYVHNLKMRKPDVDVSGVLLYPSFGTVFCEQYNLAGYNIQVRSVDLDSEHSTIANQLSSVLE
jgi:5-methylcytosine-specific restriction enzyme subunit McrC